MTTRIVLTMCCAATVAFAQLPQAAWEGEVDGRVEISIRGANLDTRTISGPQPGGLKFRVYDPLPARSAQVRLQVQQGRGTVRIAQQPGVSNDFTVVVSVDDPQGGRAMYAFQLFWDLDNGGGFGGQPQTGSGTPNRRYTIVDDRDPRNVGGVNNNNNRPNTIPSASPSYGGGGGVSGPGGSDYLRWTGTVDDEILVECRQRDCYPIVQRGGNVVRDRVDYSRPLPSRTEVRIDLTDTQGRGEIRMVEQGNARNGFTTRVKIRDTQGGAGDYAFTLRWTSPAELERQSIETGMRWSGRVDGKVRVVLEGMRAYTEILAGGPVSDERAIFDRSVPTIEGLQPRLNKRRGRGRVEVVEFPSRRNNYRLVFTVDDDKGGSDMYEIEVGW